MVHILYSAFIWLLWELDILPPFFYYEFWLLYSAEFWRDIDSSNNWWKRFGHMVTVFQHAPVNAEMLVKFFDGLNFNHITGSDQKCQNFPPSKYCATQWNCLSMHWSATRKCCIDKIHNSNMYLTSFKKLIFMLV